MTNEHREGELIIAIGILTTFAVVIVLGWLDVGAWIDSMLTGAL